MSNLNMSVPTCNFEGHLILMCFAAVCFWHVRKLKGGFCTSIHLFRKKILNYFGWVEFRILVGKGNIYEAHIFTMSLGQKCCLETTIYCLSTRWRVKKIILHSQYIYWNFGNPLTFMCSTPNFILEDPKLKITSFTYLIFMFSWCSFFALLGAEKHVFHISPFRSTCYVLKSIGCL